MPESDRGYADVNFGGDWQMLYLRVLLPVLAMGLCILGELKKK